MTEARKLAAFRAEAEASGPVLPVITEEEHPTDADVLPSNVGLTCHSSHRSEYLPTTVTHGDTYTLYACNVPCTGEREQ